MNQPPQFPQATPNLVVLDGYALNPGDLDWSELHSLGTCQIHARTPLEIVLDRAREADILLTNKTVLSREIIASLPRLQYIGVLATGFNVVDAVDARERGIPVTNVPGYSTQSVAQCAFALLLELTHHTGAHAQGVREGKWTRCPDFCYWDFPLVELAGLTLGIVGFGQIGQAMATIGQAFGMRVIAHTRTPKPNYPGVAWVDLETLFRQADVVSLHCPLTPETRGLINTTTLAWLKPTAYLLNTGRGPLVDESALAAALNDGCLAGAGLDILSVEPPGNDNPLLQARNCVITPHFAWATAAARRRLLSAAIANLRAFLCGQSHNVVN